MSKQPTFYSPTDEALCLALIDFMDTATTEKSEKYLGSYAHRMMERMHIDWMTRNGETDPCKINRFKGSVNLTRWRDRAEWSVNSLGGD